MVKTYTFDDVVNALNQIAPYDWRGFWNEKLTNHGPGAPLGGIEATGWKVVYDENRSAMMRAWEEDHSEVNASYSVGLLIKNDGEIADTIEGMDAARAGIGPGMKILAVNGRRFTPQVFRDALVRGQEQFATITTPDREHGLFQDVLARLPRRRKISAPGTRRLQAGHAKRNYSGTLSTFSSTPAKRSVSACTSPAFTEAARWYSSRSLRRAFCSNSGQRGA